MFAKKIYQWNAVDVVRSDGEVHRGIVVDKQDSHLLVDFDISGKEPELVPYQNAYLSNDDPSCDAVKYFGSDDVVILKKLSKNQPWKWYSGKVVPLALPPLLGDSFAVAEIRIGDEVITECVRSDYIRKTAYNGRPVRKNDFAREECLVPDGFSYDAQSIAPWRKRFPRTRPIGIVDTTFHFLQLRYDKDFDANEMAAALNGGIPKEKEMTTMEDNSPHENVSNNEETEASHAEDFSISDLPSDILGVVFSFLDGRQQTRLRPVCPAWNSKVLSPQCSREMVVDLSLYQEGNPQYILASWLFHCITHWTKYVTITQSGTKPAGLGGGSTISILKAIMTFKSPLSALILLNVQLEPTYILTGSHTAISANMQAVCRRLIFKNVMFLYFFDTEDYFASHPLADSFYADLWITFGSVNVDSQKELLDCFEGAGTDYTDPKHHDALERVSQAIAETSGEHAHPRARYHQIEIINVLRDWQRNDSRFGPDMEWKHVQLAQLDANLLTLRSTTLSALTCLAKGWSRDDNPELYGGEQEDYSDGDWRYGNSDDDADSYYDL